MAPETEKPPVGDSLGGYDYVNQNAENAVRYLITKSYLFVHIKVIIQHWIQVVLINKLTSNNWGVNWW